MILKIKRNKTRANIIDDCPTIFNNYYQALEAIMLFGSAARNTDDYICQLQVDKDEFGLIPAVCLVMQINDNLSDMEDLLLSFDNFGHIIQYYFQNDDKRIIVDNFDKDFNVGDIVYCECDNSFHVIVDNGGSLEISDIFSNVDELYDRVPFRFVHKVTDTMINEYDLSILYDLVDILKNDGREDRFYNKVREYGITRPWLTTL